MIVLDPAIMRYFIRYGLILSCVLLLIMASANKREFSPDMQSYFYQSVWQIRTPTAHGSGFWIARKLMLTNAHVVGDNKDVFVHSPDGSLRYAAQVIKRSTDHDLALLLVENPAFVPMLLKMGDFPKRGDPVFAAGFALGRHQNIQRGISEGAAPRFQSSFPADYVSNILTVPGDSGSPLIDEKMRVVGIRNAVQMNKMPGFGIMHNFSIPVFHMAVVIGVPRIKFFLASPLSHHHDGFYIDYDTP